MRPHQAGEMKHDACLRLADGPLNTRGVRHITKDKFSAGYPELFGGGAGAQHAENPMTMLNEPTGEPVPDESGGTRH